MSNQSKRTEDTVKNTCCWLSRLKIVGFIVGVVITLLVLNSFFTVKSGYVGVLSTLGKYEKEPLEAGLHFKIPVIQKVTLFDIKMHSVNYKAHPDTKETEDVFNKPIIRVLDSKNLPIKIEMTIQFTPKASEASFILTKYGKDYFDKLINPIIRDIARDVTGRFKAEDIAYDRSKITNQIIVELRKKFEKLPFELNNVLLRDIQLPDIILNKIKEVQMAKQKSIKLQIVVEQAKKEQEIRTIQAKTRLIEVKTKAQADADKKRIEAEAKAYQIIKEAEAQAKANKLIASSITQDLIKYEYIKNWNGVLPKTVLDKGSSVLLNIK